jgi:hypothetical protein
MVTQWLKRSLQDLLEQHTVTFILVPPNLKPTSVITGAFVSASATATSDAEGKSEALRAFCV